jgi:hypothetical protein
MCKFSVHFPFLYLKKFPFCYIILFETFFFCILPFFIPFAYFHVLLPKRIQQSAGDCCIYTGKKPVDLKPEKIVATPLPATDLELNSFSVALLKVAQKMSCLRMKFIADTHWTCFQRLNTSKMWT